VAVAEGESRKQVLKLLRPLGPVERLSLAQADAFSLSIAPSLDFETMGNKSRVVVAWLQRDLLEIAAAVEAVRQRAQKTKDSKQSA
jgi:hypothetical protein